MAAWKTATMMLALALTACQTTGDPHAGGLFGWSEDKAKQRQGSLQAEAADATQAAEAEQTTNAQLLRQRQDADVQARLAELRLNALIAENGKLEQQVLELRKRKTRMNQKLQAALKKLDSTDKGAAAAKAAATAEERKLQTERLDARNADLHKAVLMLLQS